MADDGDGFVGRCEVVEPRRGNRRWPLDLKGRIVAESFQPGVRVVDVARRHGVVAHQLSDWLRQAREGLLSLPLELLPALSVRKEGRCAFVPVAIIAEPEGTVVTQASVPSVLEVAVSVGIMTVELGSGVVVRGPGDVAVAGAAALVRPCRTNHDCRRSAAADPDCDPACRLALWPVRRIRKRSGGSSSRRTLWR